MKSQSILLVDDDADDQLFFIDAINAIDQSLRCDVMNDGVEAMVHLKQVKMPPRLIFLDLNMPKMNGYECLEAIRKYDNYKETPVIIITTSSNPREAERTKNLGAHRFITKTSDFRKFTLELNEILTYY